MNRKLILGAVIGLLAVSGAFMLSGSEDSSANGEGGFSGLQTWEIADGVLTISGNGDMQNFTTSARPPWYDFKASITSIVIAPGVTTIGNYAFSSMTVFTSVTIPDTVVSIGTDAFYICHGLSSVIIPDSVVTIGNYAFGNCRSLVSVSVPDSVTSFGERVFISCTSLVSASLPAGMTALPESTFGGCSSLKSIVLPAGLKTIGGGSFASCSLLESIVIPYGVVSIYNSAFSGCFSLTSVVVPDTVTRMEGGVFGNCYNLRSVTLSANLINMGMDSFNTDFLLTSVVLPASLKSIEYRSFQNCFGLESLTFLGNPTFLYLPEEGIFKGSSLKTVIIAHAGMIDDVSGWTFNIPFSPEFSEIVIDIAGEVYLDSIQVIDGKTLTLSPSTTTAFGGTLYASDGATVLQGADRAGHSYVAANGAWIQSDVPYVPAPDMITVTLDPAGGVVEYLFSEIVPGDPFTLLLPVKTDNIFAGWKLENAGDPISAGTVVYPESDVTYVAQWTSPVPGVSYVSVAYNGNGGLGHMFAVSVVSGSPYELLNSTLTPPADHAFAGWKLSDAGDLLHPGDVINPTENAVLYAQWTYTGTGTDPGNGDGEQNFWFREIAGISYWAILIIAFAAVFVGCIFIRW